MHSKKMKRKEAPTEATVEERVRAAAKRCKGETRITDKGPQLIQLMHDEGARIRFYGPRTHGYGAYRKSLNSVVNCYLCRWATWAPSGIREHTMMAGKPTDSELDRQGYHIAVLQGNPDRMVAVVHGSCARVMKRFCHREKSEEELAEEVRELLDGKVCEATKKKPDQETVSVVDYVKAGNG
jgi:hypothetical protein